MTKYCKTCGKSVDGTAKYCPHCKGETFTYKNELMVPESDLVHKIFYWAYPGGHMLSKSKLAALAVGLYLLSIWIVAGIDVFATILAIIIGLVIFLIGLIIHKILPNPPRAMIQHNDYGLLIDLKNLLFFWQDKNGNYRISKTKVISTVIFVIIFIMGLASLKVLTFFSAILLGLVVEIPVFIIGSAIHKLSSRDEPEKPLPPKAPVKEVEEVKIKEIDTSRERYVIPQYLEYQMKLDELNSKFASKEKSTRDLIAKRFEPPQLTYTRFISGVDKSAELFKSNSESAYTMISLTNEYSPRIAGEIEKKIDIMNKIVQKLDSLSNELIVNNDLSKKEDVDTIIDDMDNLIDSVKDYE